MSKLREAFEIVDGRRNGKREAPSTQFPKIAKAWSGLLGSKLKVDLTAEDVGLMMIVFKCVRQSGAEDPDNLIDIVGYAYCNEQIKMESQTFPLPPPPQPPFEANPPSPHTDTPPPSSPPSGNPESPDSQ